MPLHLLKLAVGAETIGDIEAYMAQRRETALLEGRDPTPFHTTRMVPKRAKEIAGQGSLYWVVRGTLACRQAITAIEPFSGSDGIGRCRLMLDTMVVPVSPRPCRPFQGWRYLTARDAPADLDKSTLADLAEMPEPLRRELSALGLI